jgi:hypothetical protein
MNHNMSNAFRARQLDQSIKDLGELESRDEYIEHIAIPSDLEEYLNHYQLMSVIAQWKFGNREQNNEYLHAAIMFSDDIDVKKEFKFLRSILRYAK